jgi:hypothetical protein
MYEFRMTFAIIFVQGAITSFMAANLWCGRRRSGRGAIVMALISFYIELCFEGIGQPCDGWGFVTRLAEGDGLSYPQQRECLMIVVTIFESMQG